MLDGLPTLFEWANAAVAGRPQKSSLEVVLLHLRGDVVNAAKAALSGSFPRAHFAHSGRHDVEHPGAAYYRWASPMNAGFWELDACLRRLLGVLTLWYEQAADADPRPPFECKDALLWFGCARHDFRSCTADPRRTAVRLGALRLDGWVDMAAGRFLPLARASADRSPIVTVTAYDIADMDGVAGLRQAGLARVEEMRAADARYAAWLQEHCTMADVTRPHEGTLSAAWPRPARTTGRTEGAVGRQESE